jgi:hypothetical protein
MSANLTSDQMVKLAEDSLEKAEWGHSRMTVNEITFNYPGGSGIKERHLLNNLISTPNTKYLEIGLWKGSTFCSAIMGNEVEAYGIDHWSFFGGQDEFKANLTPERVGKNRIQVFDHDCWTFDRSKIGPGVEVYFYDGDHTKKAQHDAFTVYNDILAPTFITVIDDWYHPQDKHSVQEGTREAFAELGYKILYEKILGEENNQHVSDHIGYWLGLGLFVVEKS